MAKPKPDPVPDRMPDDLVEQSACDLMNTIEGFCKQSNLSARDIVACLEGVKFSMMLTWFGKSSDDRDDDDGEEWKRA